MTKTKRLFSKLITVFFLAALVSCSPGVPDSNGNDQLESESEAEFPSTPLDPEIGYLPREEPSQDHFDRKIALIVLVDVSPSMENSGCINLRDDIIGFLYHLIEASRNQARLEIQGGFWPFPNQDVELRLDDFRNSPGQLVFEKKGGTGFADIIVRAREKMQNTDLPVEDKMVLMVSDGNLDVENEKSNFGSQINFPVPAGEDQPFVFRSIVLDCPEPKFHDFWANLPSSNLAYGNLSHFFINFENFAKFLIEDEFLSQLMPFNPIVTELENGHFILNENSAIENQQGNEFQAIGYADRLYLSVIPWKRTWQQDIYQLIDVSGHNTQILQFIPSQAALGISSGGIEGGRTFYELMPIDGCERRIWKIATAHPTQLQGLAWWNVTLPKFDSGFLATEELSGNPEPEFESYTLYNDEIITLGELFPISLLAEHAACFRARVEVFTQPPSEFDSGESKVPINIYQKDIQNVLLLDNEIFDRNQQRIPSWFSEQPGVGYLRLQLIDTHLNHSVYDSVILIRFSYKPKLQDGNATIDDAANCASSDDDCEPEVELFVPFDYFENRHFPNRVLPRVELYYGSENSSPGSGSPSHRCIGPTGGIAYPGLPEIKSWAQAEETDFSVSSGVFSIEFNSTLHWHERCGYRSVLIVWPDYLDWGGVFCQLSDTEAVSCKEIPLLQE